MRKCFPLYYHLTEEEKRQLFKLKNCYFVFDTNALLDIYRLGKETADKVLKLLEKFKDRIIIPRHVAREYHDNMLDIITGVCTKYDSFLKNNIAEAIMRRMKDVFTDVDSPSIKRKMDKYISQLLNDS